MMAFAKILAPVLREALEQRDARLAALETRLAGLEALPLLKDAGTWHHGSTYRPGDVAQFKGARWVCTRAHTAAAVPDHASWQLWEKTR